jgi:antitoxin YefM
MYAAYHLKAKELNADVVKTLKKIFREREIVVLPKDEYAEMEKARHNAAYTEKLQKSMRELDEGKGIIKTMAELEAMENE